MSACSGVSPPTRTARSLTPRSSASASASSATSFRAASGAPASSSLIDGLPEGLRAGAAHGVDELFAVLADGEIEVEHPLDGGRHFGGGQALADDLAQRGLLVGRAADGDLVEFLALLIDAQDADVADVVGAAGVDAARHVDAHLADLLLEVEVGQPLGQRLGHGDG